jgi:signal transduction histidine kinase
MMRVETRLARFARVHPGWVDGAVVAAALLASFASAWYVATLVGWAWAVLLNAVPPLLLGWRRRAPGLVLAVCLGFGLIQWLLAVPFNGAQVPALIALYAVARQEPRRTARIALGASLAMVLIAPLRQPYTGGANTPFTVLLVLLVYALGTNVGLQVSYLKALEERAERLERERDAAALAAASLERTRIARELHDVVAHQVSVMVVQAEGAGWAIDADQEQARTAMTTIAQTGRSTLVELRRLLGVLRDGSADGVRPQPGLADLPALIEGFRASGLPVRYVCESGPGRADELSQIPESLQLAAFRIVQESLTNVLKHAGPSATARVTVSGTAHGQPALVVEIQDDGHGGGDSGADAGAAGADSGLRIAGHGLIGIRERVALFEGQAEIGPGSAGGFGVRAVLPRSRDADRPQDVVAQWAAGDG